MCLFLFWWSFRACFVFVSSRNICQKRVWFFFLSIFFSCLLILKMCKLGAKTCYDYYLWVYLFKWGVFSSLFPIDFFISNIVKCKFIHVNVCFDWFYLFSHVSFADFFSIRCLHQFLFSFCQLLLPCSFGFVYVVDLVCWLIVRGINILFIIVRFFVVR